MAGYSIVLNLTGNSVTQTERLADNLWRAQASAGKLAANLTAVGAAMRGIPNNLRGISPAQIRAGGAANAAAIRAMGASNAAIVRAEKAEARRIANREHSRRGTAPFFSYGRSFNFGPLSGRLGQVLTPDANGNILGMNAASLMKGANIAGLATTIVTKVVKTTAKVIAGATLAPMAVGGIGIMASLKYLQSESFAEGARLISRRHQARLGLGEDYMRAEANTDFLAASYGFDRSTTLSSINTLTGLGVGGSARKLNVAEATGLTKVGGLISQHHGVPFERVMTNIQQLLVQTTPHMRDIRELLNQAPILGKYALKDMEEKGITGVDVRTYLKDQKNILSSLKRYELDVATNAGMQARGRIGLAQQDMHAKLAGNDPFWTYIGRAGSSLIGSGGDALNSLLSTLANNNEFKVMVKQLELTFDNVANSVEKWLPKILNILERFAEKYDIDLGDRPKAKLETDRSEAVMALAADPKFRTWFESSLESQGLLDNVAPDVRRTAIDTYMRDALNNLESNSEFKERMWGRGKLLDTQSEDALGYGYSRWHRRRANERTIDETLYGLNQTDPEQTYLYYPRPMERTENGYMSRGSSIYSGGELRHPINANVAYSMDYSRIFDTLGDFFKELTKVGTFNPDNFTGGGSGETGDDLSGMNRDRRALEIHFHAPIVEWQSNITTSSPQETVDAVGENIEQLASEGLQKALLGASNKMTSRWY